MQACPLLEPHFPAIIHLVATLPIQIQTNLILKVRLQEISDGK